MVDLPITKWVKKKIRRLIAIVEDTDVATHSIASGKYVVWKGDLCKSTEAIAVGGSLSLSNLSPVSDGGLNELSEQIGNFGIINIWSTQYHTGYSSTGATPTTVASGTKNLKKGKYLYLLQMPYNQDTGSGEIQVSIGSTNDKNIVTSFNQYVNYVMGIIDIPSDGSYTWSITITGGGGTLTALAYNTNRLLAICLQ